MKKFVYIVAVVMLMGVVSCSKETIHPVAQDTQEIPVWKSASPEGSTGSGETGGSGGITDPNNDKDENTRRKN